MINGAKEDVVKRIRELTEGKGVDLVIETAGSEITANRLCRLQRKAQLLCW